MRLNVVGHARLRLASLAAATALVAALLLLALAARYRLAQGPSQAVDAVVSEMVRPRAPAPEPEQSAPRPQPIEQPSFEPQPLTAPEAPAAMPTITAPHWLSRPRDPVRFYPREAFMRGVEGEVELDCTVEIDGRLACAVASETPQGHGFAAAALALADAHVMQPAERDGAPVRARYRMVVPFSVSE